MKDIIGYIGIVLVAISLVALIVDNAARKKRAAAGEEPAPKKERKPKTPKAPKTPKTPKAAKQPSGFAVPGRKPAQGAPVPPQTPATPTPSQDPPPTPGITARRTDGGATVMLNQQPAAMASAFLRYRGTNPAFPAQIPVDLRTGEFTIGRVDITVGPGQSSFEFPADTQEVSRHHAAISQDQEGYIIRDTGSSAGTFVNDTKLEPQVLYRLENGSTVSFGRAGADYLWQA